MSVQLISARLVTNLRETGNTDAIALANQFESGQISEKDFIARAGRLVALTGANHSHGLQRAAFRFGSGHDAQLAALSNDVERTGTAGRARDDDYRGMEGILS